MSSEFTVYLPGLKNSAEEFPAMYQKITQEKEALQRICDNLRRDAAYGGIADALAVIIQNSAEIGRDIKTLEDVLRDVVKAYEETEQNIMNTRWKEYNQNSGDGSGDGSSADEEEGGIWDFLKTALWQMFAGDFTDDGNWLGTIASVIIGFVPVVGQIADVRDLIADIYNLIDDGPTTSEWVDLGFTLVGFIPGVGDFLKHADDLGPVVKHLDDIYDGLGDMVKGVMKHGDEVYSAIEDTVKHYNDLFDEKVISKITGKLDELLEETPKLDEAVDKVMDFLGKELPNGDTVGDLAGDLIEELSGIEDGVKDWISDTIDNIFGNNAADEVGDAAVAAAGFTCVAA